MASAVTLPFAMVSSSDRLLANMMHLFCIIDKEQAGTILIPSVSVTAGASETRRYPGGIIWGR